jgi:putative ABC transport system permease protein
LVSFADEEAREIGLNIGDTITVNVLGRDITATVSSFRIVDFSTAGIGFVMSMNPSALQGAPHSFISTIYADREAEAGLVRDLSRTYPNITLISVRDAIERVAGLVGNMAAAITFGAGATLITGVFVLIGTAAAAQNARMYEAAVLKTLGAERRMILTYLTLRAGILGAASGLVAVVAGGASAWAVITFVMDGDFRFDPISAAVVIGAGGLVTLLSGIGFAWAPLRARPARILRAAD